jgi:hypothetical protein
MAGQIRLEVAMRVFAARFNTDSKVHVEKAAGKEWAGSDAFIEKIERRATKARKEGIEE